MMRSQSTQIFRILATFFLFWGIFCFIFQTATFGFENRQQSFPGTSNSIKYHYSPEKVVFDSNFLYEKADDGQFFYFVSSYSQSFSVINHPVIISEKLSDATLHSGFQTEQLYPKGVSIDRGHGSFNLTVVQFPDDNVFTRHPGIVYLTLLGLMVLVGAQIYFSDEERF